MDAPSLPLLAAATAWVAACLVAAGLLHLRRSDRPFGAEDGLLLGGIGVLALLPCSLIVSRQLGGAPSLFGAAVLAGFALLLLAAGRRARRARLDPDKAASTTSFREKSALLVVAGLALVFGDYFLGALSAPPEVALTDFIGATVALIALMIVGHLVIALFHLPLAELNDAPDERDRSVELRSLRNAHYLLAAGYFSVPVLLVAPLPLLTALNIWLAFLVAAEVVFYGSTVAFYRRGLA